MNLFDEVEPGDIMCALQHIGRDNHEYCYYNTTCLEQDEPLR